VARQPVGSCRPGDVVDAEFAVTGVGGRLLPAYLVVERQAVVGWQRCADDGDWTTTIEWHRDKKVSVARATWLGPADAEGTYRLSYLDSGGASATDGFTVTR
jgi:neutral ceramidase